MGVARIASIYFMEVTAERNFGGPYIMPAVALGDEPVILHLKDVVQTEEGSYSLGSNGRRSKRKHLVRGEDIAKDLVAEWSQHGIGMNPQRSPGIWMVRDQLPLVHPNGMPVVDADGVSQWREANEEERAIMWAQDYAAAQMRDRAYAELLFHQANIMAEEPRLVPLIPEMCKLAAKQYGLEAEWLKEGLQLLVKACAYCTKVIPGAAIKCPKCGEVVDIEAYALLEARKLQALKLAKDNAQKFLREEQAV